jgi:broad specificity phosphatase PhoE
LDVFDADLTSLGREQASALNSMLRGGGWWPRLTGGYPVRAVVSPLTRCLNTATLALEGLSRSAGGIRATVVEEFVRETLGEDTCDARRSASDPSPAAAAQAAAAGAGSSSSASSGSASSDSSSASIKGPCEFDKGLRTLFPSYKFDVVGEEDKNKQSNRTRAVGRGHRGDDEDDDQDEDDPTPRPFGLISDADTLWTKDAREQQKHQVKRARAFLDILFAHAQDERVAVVVTHSGFARSLLLAVEREPYRPMNAELVPVIVDRAVDEEEEELVEGEEERGGAAAAAAGVGPAAARR